MSKMEPDFYIDTTATDIEESYRRAEGGEELFNFIQKIDSREIIYSQPEIKYRLIGPYIKGDLLGKGSYGKVKECVHLRTLQRCAMKIMSHRTLRRIPNGEQNVEREIQLLRGLSHVNVIRLIDVMHIPEKQKIYMVMEYCITDLQGMLDSTTKKKFPQWQCHRYFLQLLEGLEYLHSKGVIHKDIKPGNLLLTTSSTLKIIDFGVAEHLEYLAENDIITTSQGSPYFQPPEVAGGADRFPGFKVDVWSAGVTLYNMSTGEYPFGGESVYRLFECICNKPIEIPTSLDLTLQKLLEGILIKDPYERMSLQDVKKHEWCLRKQIPNTETEVPVIPKKSSGKSFTVIEAIRHHFYEDDDLLPNSRQYFTEHDLNESRNREDDVSVASNEDGKTAVMKPKKKKMPMSCINIKGFSSCSQS